ncbi:MAG: hypothetical protein KME07_16390 [Pegethrix bostrychoides GSE-TBD4-15B]|jgi:hypothetical protein|uniref:Uncharacterized protein n=1 Tax=Pegethrix bostrychoides GSE-TBD4-15B TaxID=2839662 RepID=A0A951PEM9_9CYAN|nr:hypothetical protein [Pegethrix bostrychoides GSE-TBD4-15B]
MNPQSRKDLFVCLGIWLALEVICFGILPAMGFTQPRSSLQSWFWLSLLLGVGGAVLTASSSQLAEFLQFEPLLRPQPRLRSVAVGLISWLGLFGIGFPLFVISLQVFGLLFGLLKA